MDWSCRLLVVRIQMKTKVISENKLARELIKEGYSLVDIKPHKNDSRRTVFVFELTQKLESRLQQEKEV